MISTNKKIARNAFSDAMALSGSIVGIIVGLLFAVGGRDEVIRECDFLRVESCISPARRNARDFVTEYARYE